MHKILNSSKVEKVVYGMLFLFMLLCNMLTLRFVDDYQYAFSFSSGERIAGIRDIFESLAAHRYIMNGRLIPHFFVHLFCALPLWVFDIVNSGVFLLMILWIVRIGRGAHNRNNFLPVVVFCALWLYEPVFGEVNFWIAGSCNYLWSAVFGFGYLFPYIDLYVNGRMERKPIKKAAAVLLSFAAGAWSESGSIAYIAMAVLLLFLSWLETRKIPGYLGVSVVVAFLGYISIYLAPAQWNNKAAEISFAGIYGNILRSINMYEQFGILAIAFVVMLVFAIMNGINRKRIAVAVVLVFGSLCANFILVFANWYHGRSAMSACVLLITADIVLLQELCNNKKCRAGAISAIAVILLMTPSPLMEGFVDIYYTNLSMRSREAYIVQCIEDGQVNLEVPVVSASTKYSPLYSLRYLATDSTDTWPNESMAAYYGVDSILGIE